MTFDEGVAKPNRHDRRRRRQRQICRDEMKDGTDYDSRDAVAFWNGVAVGRVPSPEGYPEAIFTRKREGEG